MIWLSLALFLLILRVCLFVFFFKQKTAYEMRISDWSSDVCSSDLAAIEALMAHGTAEQQAKWLPRLVTGEWSGTMNLTEPQAGSDVGALRTTATPVGDGTYRIKGQKIFITFGEHDLTDNIVHLVLARTPDAPAGTKGISL